MSATVIAGNSLHESDIPTQDDGSMWPFVMFFGENLVAADTRTELVEHLIDGYADLNHDENGDDIALQMRGIQSLATADFLQEFVAGVAANEGDFDFPNATEDELTAFLTPRLQNPVEILNISHWDHKVPLVLVTSLFEPYTEASPPTGNIMWIDPTNETTYLDSLHSVGQIRLFVSSDTN